jgi:hypothetical protein
MIYLRYNKLDSCYKILTLGAPGNSVLSAMTAKC